MAGREEGCMLKPLRIGGVEARIPIIQGGMGARVSLHSLAGSVAREGGIGVISAVLLHDPGRNHPKTTCKGEVLSKPYNDAIPLREEIRKAREIAGPGGVIGVNILFAMTDFEDLLLTAFDEGIDLILTGAGFSREVFRLGKRFGVPIVSIISSAKGAKLAERSGAAAVVVEGTMAGGHLGTMESVWEILPSVVEAVSIPVIAAGGIFDGKDIAKALRMGASGVQIATRFVVTEECDVHPNFKQAYLDAKEGDVILVKSPVGMPGRAIKNRLIEELPSGKWRTKGCKYNCIKPCSGNADPYCIATALLRSASGDVETGLVFAGANAVRLKEMTTVPELIRELVEETERELSRS